MDNPFSTILVLTSETLLATNDSFVKIIMRIRQLIDQDFNNRVSFFTDHQDVLAACCSTFSQYQDVIQRAIRRREHEITIEQQLAEPNQWRLQELNDDLTRLNELLANLGQAAPDHATLCKALAARIAEHDSIPKGQAPKKFQMASPALKGSDPVETYFEWLRQEGGLLRIKRIEGLCWVRLCEQNLTNQTQEFCECFRLKFVAALTLRLEEMAPEGFDFHTDAIATHSENAVESFLSYYCGPNFEDRYSAIKHLDAHLAEEFVWHIGDILYRITLDSIAMLRRMYFYPTCLDAIERKLVTQYRQPAAEGPLRNMATMIRDIEKVLNEERGVVTRLSKADKKVLWKSLKKVSNQVRLPMQNLAQPEQQVDLNQENERRAQHDE